jgi:basic amino acid/polyamine antiporter, APA family
VAEEKISQVDQGSMKRVLGVKDLFAVGYGDLGSSIYYALGITAMFALGATPIALLLAGLVFACTALTYAEMSSVMHDSGGSATYSRKAFNDLISFIAGWGLLLDYIVTIAISSYSVGPYFSYFIPSLSEVYYKIPFAAVLVALIALINFLGVKHSTRLSIVLTNITIVTQIVIVIIGFVTVFSVSEFFEHLAIGGNDKVWSPSWIHFIKGVAMAMVAYTGIESMAQLSSEAKNPSKTVPRAIILSMVLLLLMYLCISAVSLAVLTPQELSTTYLEDPMRGIVENFSIGGGVLAPWIGLLGGVILIVAANAGLIGASRLSFNLGENFQLPRVFYKLHKKRKTPYIALIIFAVLSILIVVWSFGKLAFLADLYNFGAMLAFFSAHISLIAHRIRFPNAKRPFKVGFNIPFRDKQIPVTAIVGAISTLAVWILVIVTKKEGRILGLAWFAIGLVIYFFYRKKYNISPTTQLKVEKVKVKEFKSHKIKKILLPIRGQNFEPMVYQACALARSYKASLTIVHVLDIPFSISLGAHLLSKEMYGRNVLSEAQAIGVDQEIRVEAKSLRSRSVAKSLISMIKEDEVDLILLGSKRHSIGTVAQEVLKHAPCKVWIMRDRLDDSN